MMRIWHSFYPASHSLFCNDVYSIVVRRWSLRTCTVVCCSIYQVVTDTDEVSINRSRVKKQWLRSRCLYVRCQVAAQWRYIVRTTRPDGTFIQVMLRQVQRKTGPPQPQTWWAHRNTLSTTANRNSTCLQHGQRVPATIPETDCIFETTTTVTRTKLIIHTESRTDY